MDYKEGVSTKKVQRGPHAFECLDCVAPVSESRSELGLFESRRYKLSPSSCELVQVATKGKTGQTSLGQTAFPMVLYTLILI